MDIRNIGRHFHTITQHKLLVMRECFKVGLYRQGLLHDLSKYSPSEFWTGVKYYQGNRSPNAAEREEIGFSVAWLHHKGRNKHHFEYWIDFSNDRSKGLVGNKMPLNYVVEMVCDRIAACKVYRGENYTSSAAWEYYAFTKPYITPLLHPETQALLEKLLWMLKEEGEQKTFAYIRRLLKKGTYGKTICNKKKRAAGKKPAAEKRTCGKKRFAARKPAGEKRTCSMKIGGRKKAGLGHRE